MCERYVCVWEVKHGIGKTHTHTVASYDDNITDFSRAYSDKYRYRTVYSIERVGRFPMLSEEETDVDGDQSND